MKYRFQIKKSIKRSVLILPFLLANTFLTPCSFAQSTQSINQAILQEVGTTIDPEPFIQGKGYQTGKYDLNAIQPTSTNWTRQSSLILSDKPILKWSANVGNSSYSGKGISSPVIGSNGTIYVRSQGVGQSGGFLKAISKNGNDEWSISVGSDNNSAPVIGSDGTIYLGSSATNSEQKNGVYAINPDGTKKFFFLTDGEIATTPSISSDGTIYILDKTGKFYAINPDGTYKWVFSTHLFPSDSSSPVIGKDGTIYFGCGGNLYALNPNGDLKWNYSLNYVLLSSPTIGEDGTIYVVTHYGNIFAFNPNGTYKWMASIGSEVKSPFAPVISSDGTIYVGDNKNLAAFSSEGTKKWSITVKMKTSPILGADGTIYVNTEYPYYLANSWADKIEAFNNKGELLWSISVPNVGFEAPLAMSKETIYAFATDGYLYSYGTKDDIAPDMPNVNGVTDQSINITGIAESDSTVTAKSGISVIGSTIAKTNGSFEIPITPLKAGTKITVTSTDKAGNVSGGFELTVKDITAPIFPSVNEITDNTTDVIGTAEPGSIVKVISGEYVLGTSLTKENGEYSVAINLQKAGTKLKITSTDEANNVSEAREVVVKDVTKPILNGITDITINVGDIFDTLKGVTSIDNLDGDLTNLIRVVGTIDNSKPSISNLTYTVTDKSGNQTTQTRKLTVIDNVKPIILGITNKTIDLGSSFDAKDSVFAYDDVDNDLTDSIKVTGTVDSKKEGVYTLIYSVSDHSGNESTFTRNITVEDNIKPTIDRVKPIFLGITNKSINIDSTFDAKDGIFAYDNVDNDLTNEIKVNGIVNTKIKGIYTLTYSVSDHSGNQINVTRNITVVDNVKPIILGTANKTINIGTSFDTKTGVSAMDNVDGDLTNKIKIVGDLNTKVKGNYALAYVVADDSGNETIVTRIITVVDNVKPSIIGATSKSINIGTSFNAKTGVTATDNVDGNLTSSIKVSGDVNTRAKGTYTLTYSVSDTSGNTTILTRKISVIDNIKPVISGATSKSIRVNTTFNPRTGVTAKDNVDGNLTSSIKITGTVNTKKKGTYTLTYSVTDKSGNKTNVTRKVTVS
ncbi:immunoglobulin-like domain-containing protein [Rossellomorea sp. GAMAL-10_SWC]